jgi:hypothetical protein
VISKGKHIPLPMLLLMAGVAVDLDVNHSRPARAMLVEFESWANEYAVSRWFWRNLRKCSLCLDEFYFDDRDELKYSVGIDSEGIHFLHRSCVAKLNPLAMQVLLEGYQFPDTQHYLTVNYRGYAPRLVIGNTKSLSRGALLQVMREIADGEVVLQPMRAIADGEVVQ